MVGLVSSYYGKRNCISIELRFHHHLARPPALPASFAISCTLHVGQMGYQLPGLGTVAFPGFGALGKQQSKDSSHTKKGKNPHNRSSSALLPSSSPSTSSSSAPARSSCEISRQYHSDAWKHTRSMSWSRCRDIPHAEDTVIAYWLKHCPGAMHRHDFETLAKIHNGGPQGLQKAKSKNYWSKVSQHLRQQERTKHAATRRTVSSHDKSKQEEASSKVQQKSPLILSPIDTNIVPFSKPQRFGFVKSPAILPKQQIPLIQTLRPKIFRQAVPATGKAYERKSSAEGESFSKTVQGDINKSKSKRPRQASHFSHDATLEHVSQTSFLNSAHYQLPQRDRSEKAALIIQATWRMYGARQEYRRMRNAAIRVQTGWRRHHLVCLLKQRYELKKLKEESSPSFRTMCSPSGVEKQVHNVRHAGSPCELLYRGNLSPTQEDELLSELVCLLHWDTQSASPFVEACHSFRFPQTEDIGEACTPKMKVQLRQGLTISPNLSKKRRPEDSRLSPVSSLENTPLVIKQALLSPLMEKEIIAELATLFPPGRPKIVDDIHSVVASSLPGHEDVLADSLKPAEADESALQELCAKEGIVRKLTFTTGMEENCVVKECPPAIEVIGLEKLEGGSLQKSPHSTDSNDFSHDSERDDEELKHIDIPLLVDQSPVLISKSNRVRLRNPCNRKVEIALVSSLSDWQFSASFGKESREGMVAESLQATAGVDATSSSLTCSTSKESFLCSVACSSIAESRVKLKSIDEGTVSPAAYTECLLETTDVKSSTVYAKAIFSCLNFSLDEHVQENCNEERDSSAGHSSHGSLQQLCILWAERNVDLLTRSLIFKNLPEATGHDNQGHEQSLKAAVGVFDIQSEIDRLKHVPKGFMEERKKAELVLHQRDIIYTNIAAHCSMQERQQLYEKWEIQKLLTGRLKKIVYDLLWVDPGRYEESAELVIHYL